ncbi:hypothetical protein JCM21714_4793 [Gracilibacillus boraciitolerans JCM 21714]|uniref:Uncharacterized protein n=2 Tax=Gracilibacillus boraciitolerans TaxID=307521 RepID=W4VQ83_9BACI|nr:hypothetical protein JCM21714_4793 [Gracilibacillus boraciitolerans JCM 21714]
MGYPFDGKKSDDGMEWLGDDPLGLNEKEVLLLFQCLDCKKTDDVPEFIVGEFSVDLNEGEEVELHCPPL